ncbi:ABC transporter ATP-binding protein [Oceanicella sp. SM1341]|uniref:ABC transporter ATP-binding protein n=1 Tax=Oceanicella sp. SM1341 TaxID=1548889 RepID=UPI000E4E4F71|nr:ABC transporter ATP-binding protein [Oceanicella sp. SM1341]
MTEPTPGPLGAPLGAAVQFDQVSKRYGDALAVDRVDIDVAAGEFLTLLGASGSGKTTTLMMLAGFQMPSSGEIRVGGRQITHVAPAARNVGMVFQSYALFPHMTVAENIAFPLRMRKATAAAKGEAVARVLSIVGLEGLGGRYPRQLSGGQQQRVALARAIVFEPPVLLMDEPLGALDKHLRAHLQTEIKRIQARLGLTVLYVTHDQEEALTMSDRICIMRDGRILQTDSPETLYDRPADTYVAGFFGESNIVAARAEGDGRALFGPTPVPLPRAVRAGEAVECAIRPERISLAPAGAPAFGEALAVPATVTASTFVGDYRRYELALPDGTALSVRHPLRETQAGFAPGEAVTASWAPGAMRFFVDGRAVA